MQEKNTDKGRKVNPCLYNSSMIGKCICIICSTIANLSFNSSFSFITDCIMFNSEVMLLWSYLWSIYCLSLSSGDLRFMSRQLCGFCFASIHQELEAYLLIETSRIKSSLQFYPISIRRLINWSYYQLLDFLILSLLTYESLIIDLIIGVIPPVFLSANWISNLCATDSCSFLLVNLAIIILSCNYFIFTSLANS